jgi:hypothetical protein
MLSNRHDFMTASQIRRRIDKVLNPAKWKAANPVFSTYQRAQNRPPPGVVAPEIGVGDKRRFRVVRKSVTRP